MALRCDLIIRDATILNGTGAPRFTGDVGVTNDRIVGVGDLSAASADKEIIATGRALAPGFIDAHTHDDRAVLCGPGCLTCKSSQGVTSVVVGNCGVSISPGRFAKRPPPPLDLVGDDTNFLFDSFADYAEALKQTPAAVNTYALVGHQTLRALVMGDACLTRGATDAEIGRMRAYVAEAMASGASGFSTGLWYKPNMHATTAEVMAVAEPLKAAGGLYTTHMRDEADAVCASIEETAKIGARLGIQVHISHHKCSMPENYGRSTQTLALLEQFGRTQDIAFDVYPYPAGSTVLMPDRLRDDLRVIVAWSNPFPEMAGKDLADIARGWNTDLRAAAEKLLPAGAITFQMEEEDVRRIMAHPMSVIGSDGIPHDVFPHPRLWGTFPRVLGYYSRHLGLFSLETAVHKMTGRTAELFGMVDRGVIRTGAYADLVLFDPHTVLDRATFEQPTIPSQWIEQVWTNGVSTYVGDTGMTGAAPGRLIRRNRG